MYCVLRPSLAGSTNPVTGLRALYVNPTFTKRINELSEEESRSVLDYLFRVQIENHGECLGLLPCFLNGSRMALGGGKGGQDV